MAPLALAIPAIIAAAPTIAAVAGAAGAAIAAGGTIMGGMAANRNAKFQAAEMDQQASEGRAVGQRNAMETGLQTSLTLSKLRAGAAAGSGSATDPGVLSLAGQVGGRGELQGLTEMASAENRARGLNDEATGTRAAGSAAQTGSYFAGAGTLMSDMGSLYSRFQRLPDGYQPPPPGLY